jgi:hypothetical protein
MSIMAHRLRFDMGYNQGMREPRKQPNRGRDGGEAPAHTDADAPPTSLYDYSDADVLDLLYELSRDK